MKADFKYCADLVRATDLDRYLASLFAPAERRYALFALYAFDIEIARVRDFAREPMPGEIRLQWWREAILGQRTGEASANPVAAAFGETIGRHALSREAIVELLEAHCFDLYDEPIQSFNELAAYAAKTVATIIVFAARILGVQPLSDDIVDHAAKAQMIALVLAQLPRHSARHQLYIPADLLREHGADADDIFAARATTELRAVLAALRLRARHSLARVAELSAGISDAAGSVLLPLAPLRPWLSSLEGPDYDPFDPPRMPRWRRQWHIWRASRSLRRIGD